MNSSVKQHEARQVILYNDIGVYKNDIGSVLTMQDDITKYSNIEIVFFSGSISSQTRAVLFLAGIANTTYYPACINSAFNWVRCGFQDATHFELVASSHASLYVRSIVGFV